MANRASLWKKLYGVHGVIPRRTHSKPRDLASSRSILAGSSVIEIAEMVRPAPTDKADDELLVEIEYDPCIYDLIEDETEDA